MMGAGTHRQGKAHSQMQPSLAGTRIMFVVNVDWFFESHRLPIARKLMQMGAEVFLASSVTDRAASLNGMGIEVLEVPFSRSGKSLTELRSLVSQLRGVLRRVKPNLVHNVTVKPVLTGSIAVGSIDRSLPVVNAISGFGHLLADREAGRVVPVMTRAAYSAALRLPQRTAVIVQNRAAMNDVEARRLARPSDLRLVRGMGVDVEKYRPKPRERSERPITMLASRMIASKGVREFAQAAKIVRRLIPNARFVLVGPPDSGSPLSLGEFELRKLEQRYDIEWWGRSADMAKTLRKADVFVLPTYHEGLPKVLLEAAATGLPIVTSDIPGCREVVTHEREALLVPPQDIPALSDAILRLLLEEELARSLGVAARQRIESEFTVGHAVQAHLDIYSELLA